jgi:hypothetical protein
MNDNNGLDNPLLLVIAWINYLISYVFADATLSKLALILSIIGSIVYIYTSISKHLKNNKDEEIN